MAAEPKAEQGRHRFPGGMAGSLITSGVPARLFTLG